MPNIKEIALKVVNKYDPTLDESCIPGLIEFAEALIESYKAELLNEVQGGQPDLGEPVAYMTTDEEGSASMLFFDRSEALKYSGDEEPVNLFTESQLLAAQEELNQCSGLLDDSLRSIEMLEDQLATAEQRVAELEQSELERGLVDAAEDHIRQEKLIDKLQEQIATLTRQRDLAVEALEAVKPHVQCDPYAVVIRALSAIKESEEN